MLFAIITIVGLFAFFFLIIRSIPKASSHVYSTFSGLIPSMESSINQLKNENFSSLTTEKKVFAVIEFVIKISCLTIAAVLIYSLF